MTVLDVPIVARHLSTPLPVSLRAVRRVLPLVEFALPAAWLRDSVVAESIRDQGCVVMVCGDDELDLAQTCEVNPSDVVLRCAADSATIRRGAALGVVRYLVSTERHIAVLAECPAVAKHVSLDERGPVVLGERRLDVMGMHCEVGDYRGTSEWAAAVDRLLAKAASLRGCGLTLTRISLSGGSAGTWLSGDTQELVSMASAIDGALDEGCTRWRLPRPGVVLTPSAG